MKNFKDIRENFKTKAHSVTEMTHKFAFDKAANLAKAEKIAAKLGMKTDSETGREYYYLSVDDGGNTANFVKFLKQTDGLTEQVVNESVAKVKSFVQKAKYYDKGWKPDFDSGGKAKGDWSVGYIDLYKTKDGEKIIDKIAKKYKELKVVKIGREEIQVIATTKDIKDIAKEYGQNQKKNKDSNWNKRVWAARI